MNQRKLSLKIISAWVDREQVLILMRNGVNISEVIRRAIRAEIKRLGLGAILLSLSACAPAPSDQPEPLGEMRFIESAWIENVTGETLDLSGGDAIYYTRNSTCSTPVLLKGDSRTGPIHVWLPAVVTISPAYADPTPCAFLKSVSYYEIVGQRLTLKFNSDTESKTFTWKSAN